MEIMEDALDDLARGLDGFSFTEELSRMQAKEVDSVLSLLTTIPVMLLKKIMLLSKVQVL